MRCAKRIFASDSCALHEDCLERRSPQDIHKNLELKKELDSGVELQI